MQLTMLSSRILQGLFSKSIKKYCTFKLSPFVESSRFQTVFKLTTIKYIALLNRLKVYHLLGTSVLLPSSGALEIANIIPEHTFLLASYIGLTGVAVLSIASIPFRNVIGFLYISEDNKSIRISSVDFWGRRKDRIVKVDDWIPLSEMPPKAMDAIYLTPKLVDGTKYKLFLKFGNVLNAEKMGQVLE